MSLFHDPQGKQTIGLGEERATAEQTNAQCSGVGHAKNPSRPHGQGRRGNPCTTCILTLKNRKVGTELISYFSDTSGTASASNLKIKEFKLDYKKVLCYYFSM